MTSRVWALACLPTLASGCGAEPVEARAIWVDDFGGPGHRRIHVYDRGELWDFEVLGESGPIERVQLDPYGRGVLVRSGDHNAAWFDLVSGRRLPLSLPAEPIDGGRSPVSFGDEALMWIGPSGALVVVPLAPDLTLTRNEDGTVAPLSRDVWLDWTMPAAHAPIVFTRTQFGSAAFFRYPTRAEQPLVIALEAEAAGVSVPSNPDPRRQCSEPTDCRSPVSIDPAGEVAIFGQTDSWQLFERRSPLSAGPLELPPSLAGVQLLQVLDRAVSIWIGSDALHRYDRVREQVDSLPMFLVPPIHWTPADQGRAVILSSGSGPVYRADLAGLRAISLESTVCANASAPVVSPDGRHVAWTCTEYGPDFMAESGVVVRVSAAGLDRYVGVPMATLAIDNDGDLLLYSVEISSDGADVVGSTSVPQTLFVLTGDGVLTRVDELEPAPTPVLFDNDGATHMQGVALAEGTG